MVSDAMQAGLAQNRDQVTSVLYLFLDIHCSMDDKNGKFFCVTKSSDIYCFLSELFTLAVFGIME